MSALIIDFAEARSARVSPARSLCGRDAAEVGARNHNFTFWRGASGARYVHTVYPLLECPELPDANVLLVRHTPAGRAEVMHIGRVEHGTACANLAEIRHVAAKLGANEVHVHLLGETAAERQAIEHDLGGASELAISAGR